MRLGAIAAIAAALAAAIFFAGGDSASSGTIARPSHSGRGSWESRDRYVSARYGFSVAIPPGWHPSRKRLVPKLLAPREVVSLGNFGMRVGGGGNCGREPAASIERMRPGDALISIQEVPVFPKLRSRLRHSYPPLPRRVRPRDMRSVPAAGEEAAGQVRLATLSFSDRGRAFEALVYVDGPPSTAGAAIDTILSRLRIRPGHWDRFHGDELPAT